MRRKKDGNKHHNEWTRKNREKNKDNPNSYQNRKAAEIKAYKKEWHAKNREENNRKAMEAYRKRPRDEMNKKARAQRQRNLESYRKREREYVRERRKNDRQYRLLCNLRSRVMCAVKNRSESTKSLLGCSIPEFEKYIESQFTPEMNWSNYGKYWEIDHIKPCCSFDLEDEAQQKQCFHWSNCRPLSGVANRAKIAQDKANHRKHKMVNQEPVDSAREIAEETI